MLRWLSLLSCISCLAFAEPQRGPKTYILSIGIGQFSDPLWTPLKYAAKDAADVHRYFEPRTDGGWLIAAPAGGPGASTADIRSAFDRLIRLNTREDDTIIVYVSSHGTVAKRYREGQDGYEIEKVIVSSDTRAEDPLVTGLSHTELHATFRRLKSLKKVLIVDSCYAGVGKSRLTPAMMQQLSLQKGVFFNEPTMDRNEGEILLSSSSWGEESQESDELKNGVYTHYLLEGFGQDLNRDGAVSITEAHAFAVEQTVQRTEGRQHPSASIRTVGRDPIIVSGHAKATRSAFIYALDWSARKLRLIVDGEDKGTLVKGGIAVDEGARSLAIVDPKTGETLTKKTVRLRPSEEYSLMDFLEVRRPYRLAVGLSSGGFMERDIRRQYAPGRSTGLALELRRDGLPWDLSGVVGFQWFQTRNDTIEVLEEKVPASVELKILSTALRRDEEIAILTTRNRSLVGSWYGMLGVAGLSWERRVESEAFEKPLATRFMPLALAGVGLEEYWAATHSSCAIEVSALRGQASFDPGPPTTTFIRTGLSCGWFF